MTKEIEVVLPSRERATNWHLFADGKASELIAGLRAELEKWLPSYGMKNDFRTAVVHTVETLLCNLIRTCARAHTNTRLAIAFGRDWYITHQHFVGDKVTRRSVMYAVKFLVEQGLIHADRGKASAYKSFRRSASVWPTEKLRSLVQDYVSTDSDIQQKAVHPIRLRSAHEDDGRRCFLQFDETDDIVEMRNRLMVINDVLTGCDVRLELSVGQRRSLEHHLADEDDTEGAQRNDDLLADNLVGPLYRVFNVDFASGGRFYGPAYQNVPGVYRPYLTIDGEPTVEVDYAAMHPSMLYAELGLEFTTDPYPVLGSRDLVKATFNALLNAKGQSIRPVDGYDAELTGMDWISFRRAVKARMGPLTQFLCKGRGLGLQRKDSEIAEAVMLEFASHGIPILPLHDSFIVQARYRGFLIRVMHTEFEKAVGQPCRVKSTSLAEAQRLLGLRRPIGESTVERPRRLGINRSRAKITARCQPSPNLRLSSPSTGRSNVSQG